MAKALTELRRIQRSQLSRLTKEDLIESILAIRYTNEAAVKELTGKFQNLVKEVVELKVAVTSPDSNINKKMDELQGQGKNQVEIILK